QGLDPLLGREVRLRERRVRLVRADGRQVLPFVVNPSGGLEKRLEALRPVQRGRATEPEIGLPKLLRDRLRPVRTHLLADEFLRENRPEGRGGHRLLRAGVGVWREGGGGAGGEVLPA